MMLKELNRTSFIIFALIILLLVFASGIAQADIYKWHNARAVTQYSDNLPSNISQQASHKTIISHFQALTKPADVCVVAQKISTASAINTYFSKSLFAVASGSGFSSGSRSGFASGFGFVPVNNSNASLALIGGKTQTAYSPLSYSGFF